MDLEEIRYKLRILRLRNGVDPDEIADILDAILNLIEGDNHETEQ